MKRVFKFETHTSWSSSKLKKRPGTQLYLYCTQEETISLLIFRFVCNDDIAFALNEISMVSYIIKPTWKAFHVKLDKKTCHDYTEIFTKKFEVSNLFSNLSTLPACLLNLVCTIVEDASIVVIVSSLSMSTRSLYLRKIIAIAHPLYDDWVIWLFYKAWHIILFFPVFENST